MTDQIKITFTCISCGASPASLVLPDDYTDDDIAKCKDCGAVFGRYGDIEAEAMNRASRIVDDMIDNAISGIKGWTEK